MPIIHASFVRQWDSEYSDSGNVRNNQAPTPSNEIGNARSSGSSNTIGSTTSAAIQLQNAWNAMRLRCARRDDALVDRIDGAQDRGRRATRLVNAI